MSQRDAKKFLDHVDKDEDAQQQLKRAFGKIVKIGHEHGYHFTQEELNHHLRERWKIKNPPKYTDPDTCTLTVCI